MVTFLEVATSWTIFRLEHSTFLVLHFRTVGPPSISCLDPSASSKSSPAHSQHYCSHWTVLVTHFISLDFYYFLSRWPIRNLSSADIS